MGKYDDILDPASSGGAAVATQPAPKPSKYADIIDSEPVAQGIPTPAPTTGPAIPDTVQPQEADLWSERAIDPTKLVRPDLSADEQKDRMVTFPPAGFRLVDPREAAKGEAGYESPIETPEGSPVSVNKTDAAMSGKPKPEAEPWTGAGPTRDEAFVPGGREGLSKIPQSQRKSIVDERSFQSTLGHALDQQGEVGRVVGRAAADSGVGRTVISAMGKGDALEAIRTGNFDPNTVWGKRISETVAPIIADAPAWALLSPVVGTPLSMGLVETIGQASEKLGTNKEIEPQAIAGAAMMGLVLEKGPLPKYFKTQSGGAAERMAKVAGGAVIKAVEAAPVHPIVALASGDVRGFEESVKRSPEEFVKSAATFLVLELLPLAKAGHAGRIETVLKDAGVHENDAARIANTAVYSPNNPYNLIQITSAALDNKKTIQEFGKRFARKAYGLDAIPGKVEPAKLTEGPELKQAAGTSRKVEPEVTQAPAPKPAAPAAVVADLDKNTAKWEEAGAPSGLARELAKAEVAGDQKRFDTLVDQFKRSQERKTPGKYRDIIEPKETGKAVNVPRAGLDVTPTKDVVSDESGKASERSVEQLRDFTGDERHDAAVKYGAEIKGKTEVIAAVRARRTELADQAAGMRARAEETSDKAESDRLLNEASRVAYRSQLYNEAADAAEGVGTAATSPATATGGEQAPAQGPAAEPAKSEQAGPSGRIHTTIKPVPHEGVNDDDLTGEQWSERQRARNENKRSRQTAEYLGVMRDRGLDPTITDEELESVTGRPASDVESVELHALGGEWREGQNTADRQINVRVHFADGTMQTFLPTLPDATKTLGQRLAEVPDASKVKPASKAAEVQAAADKTETDLTREQRKSGQYDKGTATIHGMRVAIETPAGEKRRPTWPALKDHYGYVRGTEDNTGEPVDIFVNKDRPESGKVFVISQNKKDGTFDEYKAVAGAETAGEAKAIYERNYEPGWTGFGGVKEYTPDEFKAWLKSGGPKQSQSVFKKGASDEEKGTQGQAEALLETAKAQPASQSTATAPGEAGPASKPVAPKAEAIKAKVKAKKEKEATDAGTTTISQRSPKTEAQGDTSARAVPRDGGGNAAVEAPARAPASEKGSAGQAGVPSAEAGQRKAEGVEAVQVEKSGEDTTVSVPSKDKASITPKEQKKYLLAEIDKAIELAPEDTSGYKSSLDEQINVIDEFRREYENQSESYDDSVGDIPDDIRKEVVSRGIATRTPSNDKRSVRDVVDEVRSSVWTNRLREFPRVTIEVPGDGVFTIINSKDALTKFKAMAAKFPTTPMPSGQPRVAKTGSPSTVKVGSRPSPVAVPAWEKMLDPFTSKAENRIVLNTPYLDGKGKAMVATDGRRLVVALGVQGKQAKRDGTYPNWRQVVPGFKENKLPEIQEGQRDIVVKDTDKLYRQLIQAESIFPKSEERPSVYLFEMPDGSIAVGATTQGNEKEGTSPGVYESADLQTGKPIIAVNAQYLSEMIEFFRATGNESVTIRLSDDISPMVVLGEKEYGVLMPMRQHGSDGIDLAEVAREFGFPLPKTWKTDRGGTMASMKDMAANPQVDTQAFKDWFGDSKVVGDDGKPLVVYSGHSNVELYRNFDPRRSTAGGFYASEDPAIASNYSTGKMGVREYYENGSQYRFKLKNGKWGKKLWQMELTPEQQDKARAWLKDEDNAGWDIEAYWKENAPYDAANRRALARGGLRDLQSVWQFLEYMGSNIAYPEDQGIGESRPMFLRQNANTFEKLLTHLGIEWQSYDWNQPGVMPVYLRIRKPLDADKPFPADLLAALKQKAKYKRNVDEGDTHWTKDYPLKQWVADIESGDEYWTTQIPSEAIPIIKSFGYDGIKERGMKAMAEDVPREQRGINWIAFDPEQIKSAIGNRGTFDPNNADMMFSLLDETTGGGVKETTDASDTGEAGAAGAEAARADAERGRTNDRLSEDDSRWQGWLEDGRREGRRANAGNQTAFDQVEVDASLGADPEFRAFSAFARLIGYKTVPITATSGIDGAVQVSTRTIYLSRSPTLTMMQLGKHELFHTVRETAAAQHLMDLVDTSSKAFQDYKKRLTDLHTAANQGLGYAPFAAKIKAKGHVTDALVSEEMAGDRYAGIARKYGANIDEAFRDLDASNEIVGMIDLGLRESSKGDPELFASMQERGPPDGVARADSTGRPLYTPFTRRIVRHRDGRVSIAVQSRDTRGNLLRNAFGPFPTLEQAESAFRKWVTEVEGVESPDIRFSMKDEPPSKDYAELLQKLEEARENMRRAIGTTQAVERQAGQEKTKKTVRRKVDQIIGKQKARLAAAQEEAGVKPPKTMPSTMAGIEAARQRVGFVAGKREGHVRAVEDVVNESFKLEAKARGVRYYDWAIDAGNVLEQYLFEDSGSRLTDEQRIANARIALKNIFGVDRAAAIRRASSGDYLAAIKSVRAFMDQRIGGFYVKALKRLASRIRRDKLFPPEMAEFEALMESAGDPKEWKKKAWHESKDIYEQALALKASSDQQQKQIAEARSEQRESNAEVLLAEALAANKVIDPLETKPIRGVIKERMVDRQAAPDVLAATAFGGTKSHGAKIMVYRPRDGEDKANALAERARTQFYDALKALGIGEAEIARERGTRQEYDFYGTPLRMSPSQRRMFYWTTLDSDGRAKMIRNGFLVSDLKGQPSKSVKGPADDMETGIDAMQVATSAKDRAAVQSAIDAIKMVAKEARLTLIMLKGIDPLRDRGGTYAPLSIERSGQQRNLEENAVAAFDAFLEKWGRFEDRVRHKNPLLIVDFYTAVEDQIDRLSKVAHLAVPIRDAMQMLGHPEVGEAVRTRMGSLFETKMRDVYRQASGFDPVFRSPPSAMSPISRRAAAARLSALLTSILKNRYLGAGAAAFRIAMDNPGMAAKFLGSAIHPVPLWTASGKADVALMMKDGYFANRWKHDLIRALTAGPGKEMAGSTEFDLMWDRELIRGLRPMARAEMSNAAAMIRAARASGMSDAQAVEYAKTVTRETQNPSSAFDESDEYRKTRANPWKSLFFPFSGQRVVSRNLVHRAIIDAHYASPAGKDAAWRKVGLAAGALLMNLAGEYLLAQLLASIRNREGGDDEKKRNKRQLMAVVSNLADLAYPMGGGLAVDAVSSYVDGDLRGASTLVGQLFESVIRGTKKAITADDMATRIKGIIEATSGGMILAGAPYVAGVSQVLGLAAGPALRTEDSKKRGYIQKSIDDLPDDPTYFSLNQALNDAFAAATDAGVVATEDEEGNPLGLAEQKARFTQSFYAQVEKKYGEEFKKGYANWRQSR